MGTPDFVVPTLLAIAQLLELEIIAVVTQPDEPVGRKHVLTLPPVKIAAEKLDIPVLQPVKLRADEAVSVIKTLAPELIIVAAYGQIIPQTIIDLPAFGILNIHPSLLPRYRGASPISSAILNGDAETGVTIMQIDALADHGPILKQKTISISPLDTTSSLSKKLWACGTTLLIDTIHEVLTGHCKPIIQDESRATLTTRLDRDSGKIDWKKPATEIKRMVRAYEPWPGTWTTWTDTEGIHRLHIIATNIIDTPAHGTTTPGTLIVIPDGVAITCNPGTLALLTVKPEGKKEMSGKAFCNGHRALIGSLLT